MIIAILIGLAMGVLSGLLGVGGGVVLVPMLLFFLDVPQHMAQGISMLVIIPTSISGLIALSKEKLVDFKVASYIATGSTLGALISANFVQYIPADILKKVFGVFVIYAGYKMITNKKK